MIHVFGKDNKTSGLSIKTGLFSEEYVYTENTVLHLLKGQVSLKISKEKYHLEMRQVLSIQANEPFYLESTSEDTYLLVYTISTPLIHSMIERNRYTFQTNYFPKNSEENEQLNQKSSQLLQYIRSKEGLLDFHTISLSSEFLHLLLRYCLNKNDTKKGTDSRALEAVHYIENNYNRLLSLDEIADYFQVSPAYFSRFFKQQTGKNFLEYLTNFRLEKAMKQMTETNKKISVIATNVGFSNVNSFNKKFKEVYGTTPGHYRQTITKDFEKEKEENDSQLLSMIPSEEISENNKSFYISKKPDGKINQYPWKKIINIGSAKDLLQYDLRTHVKILKKELGISYIRFWNLFTKKMNIDPTITTKYNFEKIDSVLDFLVEERIKPFIELRYKIHRVHRSTREALIFVREDFKFSLNSKEWFEFIEKFMKHINDRYGKEEIDTWIFEFSFEHYQGTIELDEFISHYKKTYAIIKNYNSQLKIGGPGITAQNYEGYNYKKVLDYLSQKKVIFDFISSIIYPYQIGPEGERNALRIEDEDYLLDMIRQIKKIVDNSWYREKKILITEWNNTISNRNVINDSLYKGSYLIKNFSSVMDEIEGIAYWIGSDFFSEFIDSQDILNGGAGLIGKGNIFKPAFLAFLFMNFLNSEIILRTNEIVVTQNNEGSKFNVIIYNYQNLPTDYYLIPENEVKIQDISNFFAYREAKEVSLTFCLQSNQKYDIKTLRVNEEYGNVLAGWKDMGYRSSLQNKDIEYLQLRASPKVNFEQRMSDSEGNIKLNEKLSPNEFMYLTISLMGN